MHLSRKKYIITALIIAVLAAALTLAVRVFHVDFLTNAVRTVMMPMQKGVHTVAGKIGGVADFFNEMNGYKEENERLLAEITELKKQSRTTEQYQLENTRLKEILKLQNSLSEYTTVAANVISYMPNNWYDTIEIDKGTKDGLSVGNAVMTNLGIVGKITEVGTNWAVISSILNTDNALGAKVSRTGDIGVVEGDDSIKDTNICKLSFLENGSKLIVGDVLETSGTGGVYPPGITIGKISEISADSMGTLKYAVVEPGVKFNELKEVLVINGMAQ